MLALFKISSGYEKINQNILFDETMFSAGADHENNRGKQIRATVPLTAQHVSLHILPTTP
jgi:hypothetical protein